jgi:hypothetical protein
LRSRTSTDRICRWKSRWAVPGSNGRPPACKATDRPECAAKLGVAFQGHRPARGPGHIHARTWRARALRRRPALRSERCAPSASWVSGDALCRRARPRGFEPLTPPLDWSPYWSSVSWRAAAQDQRPGFVQVGHQRQGPSRGLPRGAQRYETGTGARESSGTRRAPPEADFTRLQGPCDPGTPAYPASSVPRRPPKKPGRGAKAPIRRRSETWLTATYRRQRHPGPTRRRRGDRGSGRR